MNENIEIRRIILRYDTTKNLSKSIVKLYVVNENLVSKFEKQIEKLIKTNYQLENLISEIKKVLISCNPK